MSLKEAMTLKIGEDEVQVDLQLQKGTKGLDGRLGIGLHG
jgi:hypothetical protein